MNEVLNKYHEDGLVYKQVHPTLPLTIWNYSERVQYENLWDDITLQTRGLVTDSLGNVVARPFRKFFNQEEGKHIPTLDFDVYTKLDGSLGILFYFEGEWIFSTRGSFTSEQSIRGFELLKKYTFEKLHKNYTYLFEIIYSENRIVCKYPFDDVILLGMIETKTGYEVDLYSEHKDIRLKNLVNNVGFKIVEKWSGISDYTVLKSLIKDNEEGFVVRFSNGNRMKIKGDEYLRLHRLMTNISTTSIWELLSEGKDVLEIIKDVPDEFYNKVKVYIDELRYTKYSLREHSSKIHDYFRWGKYGDVNPEPTKKEFALYLEHTEVDPKVRAICFAMWDKKDYEKIIWQVIKPQFKKL
jgi:RNA ligase